MDHDPLDIDGQEQEQQTASDAKRLARQQESEDFGWLMGNKRGRRIVWRLLERAGVHRTSFDPSSEQMAFNEGMRNAGLMLEADAVTSLEGYVLMLRENQPKAAT